MTLVSLEKISLSAEPHSVFERVTALGPTKVRSLPCVGTALLCIQHCAALAPLGSLHTPFALCCMYPVFLTCAFLSSPAL
jgi:hypothetical protein